MGTYRKVRMQENWNFFNPKKYPLVFEKEKFYYVCDKGASEKDHKFRHVCGT